MMQCKYMQFILAHRDAPTPLLYLHPKRTYDGASFRLLRRGLPLLPPFPAQYRCASLELSEKHRLRPR